MEVLLWTMNPSKAVQIEAIFKDCPISILTPQKVGLEGDVVEDADSLEGNAMKKAWFAYEQSKGDYWTMSDDSGIFIRALGDQPGVRSARWAGEHASTDQITKFTLKQMEGEADRSARFETVVALISPVRGTFMAMAPGGMFLARGQVYGHLLEAPRCPPQPNMPYSPIFVPKGHDLTWAEMDTEFENAISHRGQAFRSARDFLLKHLKLT